jgi:hypothetical protein
VWRLGAGAWLAAVLILPAFRFAAPRATGRGSRREPDVAAWWISCQRL